MNATDTRDYIVQGFKDLIARLEEGDERVSVSRRIRLNTAARERAVNRVWKEYREIGLEPPSDFALSVTARRELGIGIENQRATELRNVAKEAENVDEHHTTRTAGHR